MRYGFLMAALGAAMAVSACAGDPAPRYLPGEGLPRDTRNPGDLLLKYDANRDGEVTTAELNAGLRADFNAADADRDGVLNLAEMRGVNQRRLESDGSSATPLIDWNQDGHVDFQEFAAAPRSLFTQLDRNSDGTLSADEINPHPRLRHKPPPLIAPYGHNL
jgi:Ca2+-binding EF-hand superfamily protein